MMEKRRFLPIAAIAAVALVAAACSSSDDDRMATPPPPMPVAVDLASVTDGTTAEAGTLEIEAGMSEDSGNTAFACAAGGEDCTVVITVDADDDTVSATSTGGMVMAGNSADHQMTIDAAAAAAIELATSNAMTKTDAIAMEAGQEADAGPGGTGVTDHVIAIARDNDGTTVTITVDGAAEDAEGFVDQEMDLGAGNSMHVRDNTVEPDEDSDVVPDTVEEVMIVTTDIEAPTPTPFADVNDQDLNARDLDATMDGDDMDGDDANDFTALNVTTANIGQVMSSAFTAGTAAELMFNADDDQTDDMDEAFEAAGTYNGADGTYRCHTGNECTVTLDGDGMITAMSTGWIFTPDEGAMSPVADADYLHYGVWLMRTTDEDGTTYDEVQTFAGASDGLPASSSVAQVTGSASYEGGATGVYTRNHEYDSATGDLTNATSGHFTADVALTATFGQVNDDNDEGTIAENLLNTLTGTIDDFTLNPSMPGGPEPANEWSVNLVGDIVANAGTASGTANGGGAEGSFSATFHGDVTEVDHDMDPDTDMVAPYPSAVVGEFDANFGNGSVAGGFGARN